MIDSYKKDFIIDKIYKYKKRIDMTISFYRHSSSCFLHNEERKEEEGQPLEEIEKKEGESQVVKRSLNQPFIVGGGGVTQNLMHALKVKPKEEDLLFCQGFEEQLDKPSSLLEMSLTILFENSLEGDIGDFLFLFCFPLSVINQYRRLSWDRQKKKITEKIENGMKIEKEKLIKKIERNKKLERKMDDEMKGMERLICISGRVYEWYSQSMSGDGNKEE